MSWVQGRRGCGRAREIWVIVEVPKDFSPRVCLAWTGHVRHIPTLFVKTEVIAVNVVVLEPSDIIVVELRERVVEGHGEDVCCGSGGSMGGVRGL